MRRVRDHGHQNQASVRYSEYMEKKLRRNPQSHHIKALKALIGVKNQIINMTIDTGSPVSFLNWTTAKQLLDGPSEIKFISVEKLNLSAQFVDHYKHPIFILGAKQANIRSADSWEVKNASLLITERRARCFLGLDLQGKVGNHTSQKPAPSKRSRLDVLLWEQSGLKQQFYQKISSLSDRQRKSKNHVVNTKFEYPLYPIKEKSRRIHIHIHSGQIPSRSNEIIIGSSYNETRQMYKRRLFFAPIVITVKKDDSIKLALDAKPINRMLYKNKNQKPNVDELLDVVSEIITAKTTGTLYFTVLDLKYAYSQIKLTAKTAKQCNFNIVGGQPTGTYRFLTGFYGLADVPAEF